MVAVVSSPLGIAGGFGVQDELPQTLEASLAMFLFVQCLVAGGHEVALFLVTVLVSLALLESQTSVFAMVVACILAGVLGRMPLDQSGVVVTKKGCLMIQSW